MPRLTKTLPFFIFLAAVILTAVVALVVWSGGVVQLRKAVRIHTPGELIRYAQRRLQGHNKLQAVLLGPLSFIQSQVERPVPLEQMPALGKGQQDHALPQVQYLQNGQPVDEIVARSTVQTDARLPDVIASTTDEIVRAIKTAKAGQTILISPGRYVISRRVDTGFAGNRAQPITVRASQPGQVTIEFDTVEGFYVSQPFWVFENLHIRGICKEHSNCEHAFHIVGKATNTVVRNNLIEDFNAHIKVNGTGGEWPDYGLLQFNTIRYTVPRETSAPVTPIDIVAASHWRVSDNLISNFVKAQGDRISFGLFMKGAGSGGRIERNLIICTPQNVSQPGSRVGLSFGGGQTGQAYCRDPRCDFEYSAGLAANNIVAHCNDFGIDVNKSSAVLIAHNTLINTAGIDVRGASKSARVYANLLDGRIRQRDGSEMKPEMNEVVTMAQVFARPDALQLDWLERPAHIPSLAIVPKDFCGQARAGGTLPGALTDKTDCLAHHAQP